MNPKRSVPPSRFVGIDLHKHFVVLAAVDARQQVLLKPRRISLDDLPAWAEAHLTAEDAVILEATSNAWYLYDHLPRWSAAAWSPIPCRPNGSPLRPRLGDDLTHIITRKATPRPIAPVEELLALWPDLAVPGGPAVWPDNRTCVGHPVAAPCRPPQVGCPCAQKPVPRCKRTNLDNFKVQGLDIATHR